MTPAPSPATPATMQVVCIAGTDAGNSLNVGDTVVYFAGVLAFWYRDDTLYFQTAPDNAIYIDYKPVTIGSLPRGQRFLFRGSTWEVREPSARGAPLDAIADRLNQLAGTEKLEGFNLKEMFSEVFRHRKPEEIEDYFLVGTSRTTPPIEKVETGWPKPWFFLRILAFVGLLSFGFLLALREFNNPKLIPGLIIMGSFAMPMATLFLFFELNTPRNVSFYQGLSLMCVGGLVSIFISLIGFDVSTFGWLGASQAGIIEEIGKFVTVLLLVKLSRYRFLLNGMFFGAAVGAGFAAFESAGYAFEVLLGSRSIDAMNTNIFLRGMLAPFGHVAWTAITAGAFFRTKRDQPFHGNMLVDPSFLKAFAIPVVLHMLWNSPIPSPLFVKHAILGVIGWFVVFGLVQQGLRQVRDARIQVVSSRGAAAA